MSRLSGTGVGKWKVALLTWGMTGLCLLAADGFPVLAGDLSLRTEPNPARKVRPDGNFGKLPLYFIENRGQLDPRVAYYVQGKDRSLYFTSEGVTLALSEREGGKHSTESFLYKASYGQEGDLEPEGAVKRWVLKLGFVGANQEVKPEGLERSEAVFSYFKGSKEQWKAALPTYGSIVYRDLWPGIDLEYSGTVNRMKYRFIVKPGAHPGRIRLAYQGATSLSIDDAGGLEVATPLDSFHDASPQCYQGGDGGRTAVPSNYRLDPGPKDGEWGYGFELGPYDRSRELILDPAVIIYCGFLGGAGDEEAAGIAVDHAGNAYVVGTANSAADSFPVTVGPDVTTNGSKDVFVAKVKASGVALDYCGYIGGGDDDAAAEGNSIVGSEGGIAVDGEGNAYVTGSTRSKEDTFPVTVGPDLTYNGGSYDAFVARISASGNALDWCGYLGGAYNDWGRDIALDPTGNVYLTGLTTSEEDTFPVTVGPDLTYNCWEDVFVAKIAQPGLNLIYCGYVGVPDPDTSLSPFGQDRVHGIAVDRYGSAYVVGQTNSRASTQPWGDHSPFPVTVGPDLTYNGGYADAFIAKVNPLGTGLDYCGFIGGNGDSTSSEAAHAVAVDDHGNAYVVGYTHASETSFPVKLGPDLSKNSAENGFIAKINASGSALEYCGYIDLDDSPEVAHAVAVDSGGNAYVGGTGFVAVVDSAGLGLADRYFLNNGVIYGLAIDAERNIYVAGTTASDEPSLPVELGPDLTWNGGKDAFVAKLSIVNQAPIYEVKNYYCAILDREAKPGEPEGWAVEIERIQGLCIDVKEGFIALAKFFFNSAEYMQQNKTNSQYVVDLYETFLNRQPSQDEIDYWVGFLVQGLSRNVVLNWFAYSEEFKLHMESLFGSPTTRAECNLVNDFYRGFLNRLPDSGGFIGYRDLMRQEQCKGAEEVRDLSDLIALGFMQSPEYGLRNRTDPQFVEDCYNGILRRGALPAEIRYWVDFVADGMCCDGMAAPPETCLAPIPCTREDALKYFTGSAEFQLRVNEVIHAGCLTP